jgi:hypothetical protein
MPNPDNEPQLPKNQSPIIDDRTGLVARDWYRFFLNLLNRTGSGTVTSVDVSGGTTGLTTSGGPVTTSGTITMAGTLNVANGGTGATTAAGARTNLDVPSTTGSGASGTWGIDITGNAATVTNGVYTTGSYADPTWITSLAASKLTGTVATAAGGTGLSSIGTANQLLGVNSGASGLEYKSLVAGTNITITQGVGTVTIDSSNPGGTVTSVGLSLPAQFTVTGSPVTGSGTLTGAWASQTANLVFASPNGSTGVPTFRSLVTADIPALSYVSSVTGTSPVVSSGGLTPAISLASGYGDTQNPYASKTAKFFLAAPNGVAGVPTFRAIVATDIPTLNQNTTGTASNVTGTVAIANGGTGQTTQQTALNALAGAVTSGSYLRGNGTNVVMSAIQAADVPTLNQNTTGTASNVTGTVAIANGGTGQTTKTAAFNALTPMSTLGDTEYHDGTNAVRLAGNTSTTKQFLSQTGTGVVSAAPAWSTVTKTDVGLGNVENTALSTWAGSTNLTTLGTVGTGTWNATTIGVTKGGTGLTSIAALSVPVANTANTYTTVTGTAGQSIRVNAGGTAWEAYTPTSGTVTSVTGTSPVVSSGGATPAISLATGYGDTQNPYASKTANFVLAAPNGLAGVPTFRAIVAADIPTLNQNTTGTASNVTGTVAIANGGSGQTTAQAAMNAFAGAVTSGQYLRGNGTNVVMSAIQAADVPTLNQNTTGTASNVTGTVAIANGGTGQTTKVAAFDALSPASTKGDLIAFDGTDNVRLPVGADGLVLQADSTQTTGLKWAVAGSSGATITNDTSTSTNVYPTFAAATSGTLSTIYTSNAKLLYKPSTGELTSTAVVASNGIFVNNLTINTSYTIATGTSGMSAGPITVASGVTVTVASGSRWVVA